MKMRVYDDRGKERFLSPGQTVPVGWYRDGNPPVLINEEMLVSVGIEEGNPYEQYQRTEKFLFLKKINS